MEIRIDRDELFRCVSRVQGIIEKRSNMPILSTVLLSAVDTFATLTATDLEISIQQKMQAEVTGTGSITVPGRKLFEIVKESKGSIIHIKEKENNRVFVSDSQAKYNLASLPADEYPVFVEPEDVTTIEMDGEILREMINKTIYSVTMEEAGFKLSGVFTEKADREGKKILRMVSTDGHRLSLVDKDVGNLEALELANGVMIPKKGMSELVKLATEGGSVHLGFKKNNCVAKKENSLVVIRLLESKFPDYNAVIPKKVKAVATMKREALIDGMKKMSILSSESHRSVKVTLDKDSMDLTSINPDVGDAEDKVDVEYNGERIEVGFNGRYFIDALQSMASEMVELGFIDQSSPCTIKGKDDPGFIGLIMPMRL